MADVYSRSLLTAAGFTGGPTTFYTVPTGFVAVVRTISVVWGNVVISGLDFWVQRDDGTKLIRQTINITITPQPYWYGGCAVYDGRWVLDTSESLALQATDGTVDVFVSGYELATP